MTEEKAIVLHKQQNSIIQSYDDAERAANAMARSGFFADARQAAQAIVKILAGQELGFGPFASMTGVYIIQGRPALSANIMAASVKKSGRYNFRVIELTDQRCELAFFEAGQEVGRSVFTLDDARKAQTKNLDKFPRNMLYARAMSNGVRWYCPDVLGGGPVYTPEELGANVDGEGNVIVEAQAVEVAAPAADIPEEHRWAYEITNSRGIKYCELPESALVKMRAAIQEEIEKGGDIEPLERKLEAIAIILHE